MKLTIQSTDSTPPYQFAGAGHDISIPLHFNGPQPNTYGVPPARAKAFEGQGFVGDVRQGGSCNFEEFRFIAHCNGTHTECIGHITSERIYLPDCLKESFFLASLISITSEHGQTCKEHYDPMIHPEDLLITEANLKLALADVSEVFLSALIIRTLPNTSAKCTRDYMEVPPPFFTHEAMQYIVDLGVQHLLVDIPSIDRMFDEGKLSNHHIYWQVPQGQHSPDPYSRKEASVTEMIYVPDAISDGRYLLNLQTASFVSDASPSKPVIYPFVESKG